jgi:hypothetical protein
MVHLHVDAVEQHRRRPVRVSRSGLVHRVRYLQHLHRKLGTVQAPASLHYQTDFEPALYKWLCGGPWQEQTYEYSGGATTSATSTPDATYCVPQGTNTTFTKHTTAFIFSAGITIPAISFSASTQTGYDSDTALNYHYAAVGQLCGANDYPGGTPARIVAGVRA